MKTIACIGVIVAMVVLATAVYATSLWDVVDSDYKHASPEAVENWKDLKFGLRVHMGLYNIQEAEAGFSVPQMTNEQKQAYFDLYKQYNPKDFDAERWMKLLERGGMKFFTITTKHCDGFCLFDTDTRVKRRVNWTAPGGPKIEECDTDFDIMQTPFKRDIIKELCDAAHKHDIAIDLYFLHWDWHDADFSRVNGIFCDPKFTSWDCDPEACERLINRHQALIRELLSKYGKIDMMCLDMYMPEFLYSGMKETIKMARKLQPDCLFRERGIGAYGDYYTPENWVPDAQAGNAPDMNPPDNRPWMVIYNLASYYSYDPDSSHYKPATWVLSSLIDVCAKGGNFMINFGPDKNGWFHPKAVEAVEYAGDWLTVNGEAIYKTRPWQTYRQGRDIRFTRSKDRKYVYAITLKWPGRKFSLGSVRVKKGKTISMLGYDKPLSWRMDKTEGLVVDIPEKLQSESNRPCKQAWAFKLQGAQYVKPLTAPRLYPVGSLLEETIALRLRTEETDAQVIYTTDGTDPKPGSLVFDRPIILKKGQEVRARTYREGQTASEVVSYTHSDEAKVAFGPRGSFPPEGYFLESGQVYGGIGYPYNNLPYGWSSDSRPQAVERSAFGLAATCIYFKKGQKWTADVANGTYKVTVVVGGSYGAKNTININGVNFCKEFNVPTVAREFTRQVEVRDGKLVIDCGEANDKQTEITQVVIRGLGESSR